jgi:DNA-binding transcriptional LysR family regulator
MDRLASMETFIRVVETGSFSGAARQLRVGQPAVSKTVAQLETYLGVKLLTRSTRGLTPTEAGLGYFERAGTPASPADLSKHQAVVYLQGEGSIWSFRRDSSEAAVKVQSRLKVTAAEGVRAAVLAHAGLTIASEWMFTPELR